MPINLRLREVLYSLAIISFCLSNHTSKAQNILEETTSFFEFEIGESDDTTTYHYQTKLVVAPILSYEPATSFGFGVGTKVLFKPKGADELTRTSNIPIAVLYTLKNQFIFYSDYVVFFPDELWLLKGSLGFSKYPVSYFGVGRETQFSDQQEIDYNNILIEPLLLRKFHDDIFIGGGLRYVNNYNVHAYELEGTAQEILEEGIESASIGLELAVTIDRRDNVLNASDGIFLEFTHGVYDDAWGSTDNYMLSKLNFRKYYSIRPGSLDVIAIEAYGRAAWGDSVPVLELSTLGGSEFLRGYQEGRFRDKYSYFAQAEYRWQTWESVGFVFFAGLGDVMADERFSFNSMKYTLGSGLRLKIVKKENINIRLDYGLGIGNGEVEGNFFLGLSEAF